MAYKSFEELEVWKRACNLATNVYEALRGSKDYGFKDQMMRAALSVPSNIAEGAERGSAKEFVRFLHIAKGSAGELRTQLYIAKKVGVLDNDSSSEMILELKAISSMLQGLIKSLNT